MRRVIREWLSYQTPVFVKIQDPRLGCLAYSLSAAIFIYLVAYNILYRNSLVEADTPSGIVRLSLRQPTVGFCKSLDDDCHLIKQPFSELSYCAQNPNASAEEVLPCRHMDDREAAIETGSWVHLVTYLRVYEQRRPCRSDDDTCTRLWASVPAAERRSKLPAETFVAQVERFTMMLDHSASAPSVNVTGPDPGARGYIRTDDAALCSSHPSRSTRPVGFDEDPIPSAGAPCYIIPNKTSTNKDFFEISVLLALVGVDLDVACPAPCDPGESRRREGVLLVMEIVYTNFRPWVIGLTPVEYEYKVFTIPVTPKRSEEIMVAYPNERVIHNTHGIQIYILQSGRLGQLTALRLLITLSAALAMLTVANFMVDTIALYVLPERDVFERLKYPKSKIKRSRTQGSPHGQPWYRNDDSDTDETDELDTIASSEESERQQGSRPGADPGGRKASHGVP